MILNERQRRIYLLAESLCNGWGEMFKIAQLSSVTKETTAKSETESFNKEYYTLNNHIRKERG